MIYSVILYLSGEKHMIHESTNPLAKHFRQPKLYISLPSKGNFYRNNALEQTENQQYPVYSMTAKDELTIKTPDALLNGQATVNVIQSCMPNIKNAWEIPSIDIDAILIAMRIATYGEKMEISITIPNTDIEKSYEIDLRMLLDELNAQEYQNLFDHKDFSFQTQPSSYKRFTEIALKTFEEQRLFSAINDNEMKEEEKLRIFNESFSRITDININNVIDSVVAIKYQYEEPVTNKTHIKEFFDNADKDMYASLIDHIDQQREKFSIKPFKVSTTEEEQQEGAPAEFDVPISFDQSNFFA